MFHDLIEMVNVLSTMFGFFCYFGFSLSPFHRVDLFSFFHRLMKFDVSSNHNISRVVKMGRDRVQENKLNKIIIALRWSLHIEHALTNTNIHEWMRCIYLFISVTSHIAMALVVDYMREEVDLFISVMGLKYLFQSLWCLLFYTVKRVFISI